MTPSSSTDKKRFVHAQFQGISHRYDAANTVLSGGLDRTWRRKVVSELRPVRFRRILDLCAGTLPLTFELLKHPGKECTALDLSLNMLRRGAVLASGRRGAGPAGLVCGEAEQLPFRDASFDGAMVGFGIRNLAEPAAGFRELMRVLRPGGRLVILEFSRPPCPLVSRVYLTYLRRLLPVVAGWIAGHREAYEYLARSILEFSEPEQLAELLRRTGFVRVRFRALTLGVVTVFTAETPAAGEPGFRNPLSPEDSGGTSILAG